jgi:hypothetical protein
MTWHPYTCRSPKFSDDFEREMANDITYHLGRDETSWWKPLLRRLWQGMVGIARSARSPRASPSRRGQPSGYALLSTPRPWSTEAP